MEIVRNDLVYVLIDPLIHTIDGPIVGADVVEFNPSQDLGNLTASVAAKIVREIAGGIILG